MLTKPAFDAFLFFIMNQQTVLYFGYGLFLPYFYSFVKYYNPIITPQLFYIQALFINFGVSLGNYFVTKCLPILGIRCTMRLGSVLFIVTCSLYYTFTSTIEIYMMGLLIGALLQFIVVPTNLYFYEMHPEVSAKYIGIVFTSVATNQFFWTYVANFIVNPNNEKMITITNSDGSTEKVFSIEVAGRIKSFLNVFWIAGLVMINGCCFFFNDPEKYRFRLFDFLSSRALSRQDPEIDKVQDDVKDMLNKSASIHSRIIDDKSGDIHDDLEEELVEQKDTVQQQSNEVNKHHNPDLSNEEVNEQVDSELRGLRFYVLLFTSIVRLANFMYFGTNVKNILFTVSDNDFLVTTVSGVTQFSSLIANYYAGKLWETFGPIKIYAVCCIANLVCDFIMIFCHTSFTALVIALIVFRVFDGANFIFNYVTLYTFYPKPVALLLLKYYESLLFFAFGIGVILNFTVKNENYSYPFFYFLVIDGIGLYLVVGYLRRAFKL